MHARRRQIVAALAALGWIAIIVFCVAGPVSGFGLTPNMSRFFIVILIVTAVLTITAVIGYTLMPLIAANGVGVRAAMRTGRDGSPRGRHVRDDDSGGKLIHMRRLIPDGGKSHGAENEPAPAWRRVAISAGQR